MKNMAKTKKNYKVGCKNTEKMSVCKPLLTLAIEIRDEENKKCKNKKKKATKIWATLEIERIVRNARK